MINVYTKEDYAKSYMELLEIFRYISYEDVKKIPREKLAYYEKNKDITYLYSYNPQLSFEEQTSKLTKILIANLYIDYWTTAEQRTELKAHDREELNALEMEKKKKYPTKNLFSRKNNSDKVDTTITSMTVINQKSIFSQILCKIKKLFKLT